MFAYFNFFQFLRSLPPLSENEKSRLKSMDTSECENTKVVTNPEFFLIIIFPCYSQLPKRLKIKQVKENWTFMTTEHQVRKTS